jgi:hypothetical protein
MHHAMRVNNAETRCRPDRADGAGDVLLAPFSSLLRLAFAVVNSRIARRWGWGAEIALALLDAHTLAKNLAPV